MIRKSPEVYLAPLPSASGYAEPIQAGLERTGFFDEVARGSAVFIKPNLTFPTFRPGVMTSVEAVSAVTEVLIDHGYRVVIGEADGGGYNRFSMDEVFQKIGLNALAARTGAHLVNISFADAQPMLIRKGSKRLKVPLPKLIMEGVDAFITMPVPKIHMNSLISMSIKNQWGCIQEPAERLKLHPYLAEVMFEVCRRLPKSYSIMDGRYGLNRSGPMRGDVVDLNWVLISNDLVAADRVGCRLLQVDERRVAHLQYFRKQGWWCPFEQIGLNTELEPFLRERFYLKRQWTDLPGLACFNNSFLAWLGYHSPLASFLHWLLYRFREPFYDHDLERRFVRKE